MLCNIQCELPYTKVKGACRSVFVSQLHFAEIWKKYSLKQCSIEKVRFSSLFGQVLRHTVLNETVLANVLYIVTYILQARTIACSYMTKQILLKLSKNNGHSSLWNNAQLIVLETTFFWIFYKRKYIIHFSRLRTVPFMIILAIQIFCFSAALHSCNLLVIDLFYYSVLIIILY